MKIKTIDINCDVGEGIANESLLFPFISSCSIACGGHIGDADSILDTILLAKKHGVKIGAHPSFPDRENFGRKRIDIPKDLLVQSIQEQIALFLKVIKEQGQQMNHIKAHGALYNAAADDEDMANLFLEAIEAYKEIPLYVPYRSKIYNAAQKRGFKICLEAFADRNYNARMELVSRNKENALIQQPEKVLQHVRTMALQNKVKTIDGTISNIKAETFCVHGDTPSALEILTYLHNQLPKYGIQIRK